MSLMHNLFHLPTLPLLDFSEWTNYSLIPLCRSQNTVFGCEFGADIQLWFVPIVQLFFSSLIFTFEASTLLWVHHFQLLIILHLNLLYLKLISMLHLYCSSLAFTFAFSEKVLVYHFHFLAAYRDHAYPQDKVCYGEKNKTAITYYW